MATFRRFSSESTTTSRPRRRIATRSATRSTSDSVWDERKIVRPCAVTSASSSWKLVLHQRIESRDRFVEDEQLGLMHEGLHEAELLTVAGGELPDRPIELGAETIGELVTDAPVDAAVQRRQVVEHVAPVSFG